MWNKIKFQNNQIFITLKFKKCKISPRTQILPQKSKFYGSKFKQGQSVLEFMTEVEQTVSRLRAIEGIAVNCGTDDQIITQVLMSLPPSLKLNFGVAWDSTPAQEKTLRNLTTRLLKMEKNIKQSEEENSYNVLMSMKETEKKV
jgi:hypothetical protein